MKKCINHHSQVMNVSFKSIWLLPLFLLALSGCGGGPGGGGTDGGTVVNTFELPRGYDLTLWCPNAGIASEECVLFDPNNPFARSVVNDVTKWDLNDQIEVVESNEAGFFHKARYYLWATALARTPKGENQFYTAKALHDLFVVSGNLLAKDQAIKGYRSVLDNYFDHVTKNEFRDDNPLKDWAGEALAEGDASLLGDLDNAVHTLESWGYIYDTANNTIAKKSN